MGVAGAFSRSVGGALHAYLRRVAPGVRFGGAPVAEAAWGELLRARPDRRIFLYYWTEAGLPLMLYGCREDGVLGRDLAFVHDETVGGRVTADVVRRLGRDGWPLRHRSQGELARDVAKLIGSSKSIGIAVDGRGPYGRVGPEFPRLAARCEAIAVPLGIRTMGGARLRLAGPVHVPRRGTEVALALGAPIDCAVASDDLVERLQVGLEAASSAAGGVDAVARAAGAGA